MPSLKARKKEGFNDSSDLVGAPVETSDGTGIVRSIIATTGDGDISSSSATPILVVDLKDTKVCNRSGGSIGTEPSAPDEATPARPLPSSSSHVNRRVVKVTVDQLVRRPPACAPGTCVETTLGTGVLVAFRPSDGIHVVRLWKARGAGSALAYFNRASLLRTLPAAVGVRVLTPRGEGCVLRFMGSSSSIASEGSTGTDRFLVELAADRSAVVIDEDSISCPVAKVRSLGLPLPVSALIFCQDGQNNCSCFCCVYTR